MQVTTKLYDSGASLIVPALGHTWSHVSQTKLMLNKRNTDRYVLVCYDIYRMRQKNHSISKFMSNQKDLLFYLYLVFKDHNLLVAPSRYDTLLLAI